MTDEHDNDAPQPAAEEQAPQCGERLAKTRIAQDVAIVDIAKELHISEDKVEALERNDFEPLGAAVFAKGYIRKYAQLVGLDEAELLAEYETLASASSIEPILKARPRPRREMSPGPWIAVIVVIIIAATAYWWFTERPLGNATSLPAVPAESEPEALGMDVSVPPDVVDSGNIDTPDLAEDTEQSLDTPGDTAAAESADAAVVESQVDEQPPVVEQPVDDGQLSMLLTFSGDCWTEISDGNGRRLFFGLGTAGRTVELSGEAPFNALFGNAANVRIDVNGVRYAIKDSERRGRTARMTVGGS
ncbi:MAG: DUF4115 domain-containing protein [Gammaproteobacteria bacterium]|nr:DUF4115 domain-containing protein [Gammaproteobacteria bacterium]